MNAKNRFCLMLLIVASDRRRARMIPIKSPLRRVTPALSIATSVPVPMAMPTSAAARAGASFTPSPAIATTRPDFCSLLTTALFWSGSTSASTSEMPSRFATAFAVVLLSPVSIMTLMPSAARAFKASCVDCFTGSAMAKRPANFPSSAILMTVAPSPRSASACASIDRVSTRRDCI
ncbi:hypothetical protein BN961_04122 [Afipia felis]|uniref:Uncharacterized protein n=1 Tax=Afipia felis TaxID=1035 RepID=A0A090MTK2_AFIFE|nr:hypothetical protein BN961_04122 [Afipia felis]